MRPPKTLLILISSAAIMATLFSLFCALFLLFNLHASARLVFEDGYTVNTVLDGNNFNVNPHSILPLLASTDLIVLDSAQSAFFTVSFSPSQDSEIKRLSGDGFGFSDGDLATAMFKKPKSFAVDLKGNVYVADKGNLAIRKISKSGVTTIAGGSKTPGNVDGPGRNASFSTDFELAFIPERCALMICDHGHKLVRQINLKSEDCARGSHSALGMSTWARALALGVSCLAGLIIGFVVRPYLTSHTGRLQPTLVQCDMEAFPNPSGETTTDLLLRHQKRNYSEVLETKALTKSQMFAEQLKDLMTFDEAMELPESADKIFEQVDNKGNRTAVLSEGHQRVDNMIYANIMGFEEHGKRALVEEPIASISGLVRRR